MSRLESKTYDADEPVGIAAVLTSELPGPLQSDRWHYVPERIWNRILHLGSAYELHFASIVDPVVDTVLNSAQWDSVEDELLFLKQVVNDDAAKTALSVILEQGARVRGRPGMSLVLSPP